MRRRFFSLVLPLALLGSGALTYSFRELERVDEQFAREVRLAQEQAVRMQAHLVLFRELAVPRGGTFAETLADAGLERATVAGIVAAASQVYDLRRVRAGSALGVGESVEGDVRAVRYRIDPEHELRVLRAGDDFRAQVDEIPFLTEVTTVTGVIQDSLFNAVLDAGERPELALELADIFGWDLDFYTDPQPGDTFSVVIERKTARGEWRYGKILAAEYNNTGNPYQALLFRDPAGQPAYYAPDGKSLKKAFLRSPLKFAAPVTSRFSRSRFHPILKRYRPHLGTDYGAPRGTPVQAIGEGRVVAAGWMGGGGNGVRLHHPNGYETMYLHLSRILVRRGAVVHQGQVIGLVGATGLATGPHLDFRITQHGQYRNFEALRLPPAEPVAKSDWEEFVALRDKFLPRLPDRNTVLARAESTSNTTD
ncbi:MAG TPA: peptidoglycan DD-metalloendopeptidase family protein [Terriglobales bacterium]|nr:peptidoglycan DD-metalloendopeptidase family protein [Terriglobales bacterium]